LASAREGPALFLLTWEIIRTELNRKVTQKIAKIFAATSSKPPMKPATIHVAIENENTAVEKYQKRIDLCGMSDPLCVPRG
jgi:hypothetical protein